MNSSEYVILVDFSFDISPEDSRHLGARILASYIIMIGGLTNLVVKLRKHLIAM